jgi:hypothetical protein
MVGMSQIPRRGSCRSGDRSYDPWLVRIRERIEVRVDGRRIPGFIAFDCDRDWVIATNFRENIPGGPSPVQRGGRSMELIHRGTVTVRWR